MSRTEGRLMDGGHRPMNPVESLVVLPTSQRARRSACRKPLSLFLTTTLCLPTSNESHGHSGRFKGGGEREGGRVRWVQGGEGVEF